MEVYISIDGVLRNLIQKFDHHYEDEFIDADVLVDEDKEPFEYKVTGKVQNDNLFNYYAFESIEEYNNFVFIDFALEIFGHASVSENGVVLGLNRAIHENPKINFTIVGLDEMGKAKTATLFFLSKSGFLGNNIKFIRSENIKKEWKKCDLWITDNKKIIDSCPINKKVVKYCTEYNEFFTHKYEVKTFKECLKYWEKSTTLMWIDSLKDAVLNGIKPKKTTEMPTPNKSN
jgi:hypothetical protein